MPISRIKTDGIQDDAITSAKIGVDVIVADDLAANSVTVSEITDGAVTGAKLANNLNYDSGTLYLDSTNNRVGIGTSSPAYTLQVGEGNGQMSLGNATSGNGASRLKFLSSNTQKNWQISTNDNVSGALEFTQTTAGGGTTFAASPVMIIDSSGKVGIGNTIPSSFNAFANQLVVGDGLSNAGITIYASTSSASSLSFADGTVGDASYRGYIYYNHFNDSMALYTAGPNERLLIDSTGNVGIGTSSPNNYTDYVTLTLNDTNGGEIDFEKAGTVNGSLFTPSGTSDFQVTAANASGNLRFSAGGYGEAMRLDSSGNLYIGGTSPSIATKVGVIGGSITHRLLNLEVTHTTAFGVVGFMNGNGSVGSISMYSSSVAYNTTSDYRLKENVTADWDATTRLKQLNPVRFNFIADADTTVDGFLAHEVQSVVPEAITGEKDAVDADGNPVYQGIDQSKLVPLLVKTIQELEARITALESN